VPAAFSSSTLALSIRDSGQIPFSRFLLAFWLTVPIPTRPGEKNPDAALPGTALRVSQPSGQGFASSLDGLNQGNPGHVWLTAV
jgi:hypothetical protein